MNRCSWTDSNRGEDRQEVKQEGLTQQGTWLVPDGACDPQGFTAVKDSSVAKGEKASGGGTPVYVCVWGGMDHSERNGSYL